MTHRALFHPKKSRPQITLNAIGDGVVRIDTNGRIEYLNPSASRLIGNSRRGCAGTSHSTRSLIWTVISNVKAA